MIPSAPPIVRGTANTCKIRVLVVDDSLVIRQLVQQALAEDPYIEVVGSAANGRIALEQVARLRPDVVTLDIEMPEMTGVEALRHLRKDYPRLRTIMFSTLTTRGAAATFEALSLGADDYVTKASNAGSLSQSLTALRSELIPKIRQFFTGAPTGPAAMPKPVPKTVAQMFGHFHPRIVAIGVSTGGPQALAVTIPALPESFRLPIVIVQHMPPMFTRLLAESLNRVSPLTVVEAEEGMEIQAGHVYIAPGNYHLRLRKQGSAVMTTIDQGPPENSCRPSADVLFRSVAEVYRGDALGVVMTGMGADGVQGVRALKAVGGRTIIQDKDSSVVWGMPGSVADAGLADHIFPLAEIAPNIVRLAGDERR